MREALNAVQLRIAFIGHPREPKSGGGWPDVSTPDWSKEIALIQHALKLANGKVSHAKGTGTLPIL